MRELGEVGAVKGRATGCGEGEKKGLRDGIRIKLSDQKCPLFPYFRVAPFFLILAGWGVGWLGG